MPRKRSALAGLLLLTAIPVLAGGTRLGQLAGGARITEENARFFHSPVPVVVHIVGATLFCVLGAFQITAHRRGHRRLGQVLLPAGMAAALSGLWMTLAYDLPELDSALLNAFRLVFGVGMAVSLVLGYRAARRRDFRSHQRWMLRGYAIALGAGTQVLTVAPFAVALGHQPGGLVRAFAMAAGWLINLAVAEWYLRSHAARPRRGSHESDRAGTVRHSRELAA